MKAKDIMTRNVITVTPDANVETIAGLLTKHRIGGVPVVDRDQRVMGIVTERDLFLKEKGIPFSAVKVPTLFKQWVDPARLEEIYARARHHTARQVMTEEVVCVDVDDELGDVACLMAERDVKRVPVLEHGKLAGIITRADIIGALAQGKKDRAP